MDEEGRAKWEETQSSASESEQCDNVSDRRCRRFEKKHAFGRAFFNPKDWNVTQPPPKIIPTPPKWRELQKKSEKTAKMAQKPLFFYKCIV